jgi:hypothetical protein
MAYLASQFGHSCGCAGLGAWAAICALAAGLIGLAALAAAFFLMAKAKGFEAGLTSTRYADRERS